MKNGIKKRILSLVLCISMILPMVVPPMPVYSVEADDADPRTAIGAVAEFKNTGNIILDIEPVSTGGKSISVDLLPTHVVIKNYYYDEVNDEYWYQIDSAPGNKAWPTDYAEYHWAYADDLTIIAQNGMTSIFDASGNTVSTVTLPLYDKISLSAESSLQGSVEYQWQIEYESGKWVDIYGEDESEITLSIGMIATLLVDDSVNIRCVSTSASKTATSGAVTVVVDFSDIDGGEDPVEPDDTTKYSIEVQHNGCAVSELKTADSDYSFAVDLSVVTTLSGNVTYTWAMVNSKGTYTLTDLTAAAITLSKMSHINSYLEEIDDSSVFTATLRVTATDGVNTVSTDVAIYVYENAVSDWVEIADGEYVDFVIIGDGVADTTVELTKTTSSVPFPEGETALLALDITLRDANGNEWQPAVGEEVTITVNAYQLGLSDGDYFAVYHVHDGETQLLGPYQVVNGYIIFEVKGFSEFVFSTNYGAAIGGVAEFAGSSVILDVSPVSFAGMTVWVEKLPTKIVIENYYFDNYLGKLFYEIDAAPGYTWPAEYANLHWCYSDALTNIDVNGEAGVYDANGSPVTDATVSTTDSVTVKVVTSLQSADIDYKWQICYDTANDLWVDITGETAAEITLTAGMVASLMDENNQVLVRCVTTAGSKSITAAPITVTLYAEDSGETEEPKVEIQIDGASADSVDVNDADKYDFNSVLSANTNLSGTLTYSWDVLYDTTNDIWEVLGTDATFAPCFDAYGDGVWLRSYYIHYVDAATSAVTVRLTVSNGVTTLTDTFTINVKYEVVEEATPVVYSRMMRSASSNSGVATAEETTTTYNVIINYLDENGEKVVADPYTSVVSPTTILTNTISFPKIVGYAPMVYDTDNAKWVRQDSYTFDGTPFTGDFVLNVRYYPDAVDYKVNIYIQNAENDEYTLMTSYVRQELTGTVLEKITFNVDGYYQSKFSSNHAAIAADGSTEFNLYYDRIYYLMKFDLDGGYGVQPIYARHGVKLDIPNPTKAGYTFVGWDQTEGTPAVSNELLNDGIANTMYEYMPIGNTAYKAVWKAVDNAKVTIVYWGENPNDEEYSYKESVEIYAKPGTQLTFGANQLVCTLEPHQHNNCDTICYTEEHVHTLEGDCYELDCDKPDSHSHDDSDCALNCTHGAHTDDCYTVDGYNYELKATSKPTQTLTNVGNGIYTYTTVSGYRTETHYYLKLDGQWYCAGRDRGFGGIEYSDTQSITLSCDHGHTNVCYSCGLNDGPHVHSIEQGCYDLICTTPEHMHDADCYSCIAHTHTNSCYLKTPEGEEYDSKLWTLVKSDTVTVAADGSTVMNVYYDRTSFTYTFYPANSSSAYGSITDKWGANIYDRWRAICAKANDTNNWTVNSDGDGPWTSYIGVMGTSNMNYYGHNGSDEETAYYYFEKLDGTYPTDTSDANNPLGVPAESSGWGLSITKEDVVLFEGFTYQKGYNGSGTQIYIDFNGDNTYGSYNNAKFYFSRNKYILEFNNGESIVKTVTVPYQGPLSGYAFTPTAPSYYEAGSVEFAGWYQNPECTGEEVKLDGMTMSASNLILYAKWVPVQHDVTIYRYKNADGTFPTGNDILYPTFKVSHGSLIQSTLGAIPEDPENGNYTFVTWAYYDEEKGKEIEITLDSFNVTKDVEIYAKWSSNVQIPYTIKYMIEGTTTEIAVPSEGKHYAGETHTFDAKTAGQLNAGYQTGYFPTITSHSIDFKAEDSSYEYIFYYVQKPSVPYTVYYVTETPKEGDTLQTVTITEKGVEKTYYMVADTRSTTTTSAIVTENFVKVTGYMPDAYQKTLIIDGAENAVNQIVFVYSVNTTQAYYKVTHWTEQTDGSWFAHKSYENVGTIGDTINESPMDIEGFTYDKTTYTVGDNEPTTTNSALTADGLEIDLYYKRNKYPYTVQYVLQGTDTVLYTETVQDQYYGDTVSHTAPLYWEDGDVYERVSAETLSTTIQTDASKNLITFYYVEREVTIKYVVANGFGGTVNPSQETVLIKSEDAAGSVAAPLSNAYKFVGWYDQSGNLVGEELEFIPEKVNGLNVAATYCAKFEYNLTSLTIVKAGAQDHKDIDPNQSFIFDIYDGNTLITTVTVNSTSGWQVTVDGLTVGKQYTVTEKTDWSWRYEYQSVVLTNAELVEDVTNGATITLGLNGTITFTNTRGNEQWLDGDSWCNNLFKD